jgi:hypothetical protein
MFSAALDIGSHRGLGAGRAERVELDADPEQPRPAGQLQRQPLIGVGAPPSRAPTMS